MVPAHTFDGRCRLRTFLGDHGIEPATGVLHAASAAPGNRKHILNTSRRRKFHLPSRNRFVVERIAFIERHNLSLGLESAAISDKFVTNCAIRAADILLCAVDKMKQNAASFDMPKEPVTEAMTFMSPLDQARYIRKNKLTTIQVNDTQLRMQWL